MDLHFVVALVIAIPVILFPAAFLWYMDIGGIIRSIRHWRLRKLSRSRKHTSSHQS